MDGSHIKSSIDGLPDLQLDPGPHATCHWMLPKLLAGSFPGDRTEPNHSAKVRSLLDGGVNTFICLQEHGELKRFTPYVTTAETLRKSESTEFPDALEFFHCPIQDNDVTSDDQLLCALRTLVKKLLQGRGVYVHCWGGHGRTGTLICALLVTCYGLSPAEAEDLYNKAERLRGARNGIWPGSAVQREQVERFAGRALDLDGPLLPPLEDWSAGGREVSG
ncbi:unnamed protein product [Cladocopium goreaui]|nr:unnamed protein product [Cladocopium goreaui]